MSTELKNSSYKGNPNLKPVNITIGFDEVQTKEFAKCLFDPIYFIENYIKIINVDAGLVPFEMYEFQENIVNTIHKNRRTIVSVPRQSGKTTSTAAYAVWCSLFNESYSILIAANKARTASEIMRRIKTMYQYLPKWLQQGVVKWNETSVEFENGSMIMAVPTSSDAARGFSFNMIVLDEFAFLPNNVADEFFTSVIPTISSGKTTKIAILSTPKGLNHFYKLWMDAQNGITDFIPIEIKWNDIPGRDEAFKEEMIKTLGGDVNRWLQEFQAEFLGSSDTLISASTLRNLTFREPIRVVENINFFEEPEQGHTYFITVDSSEGKELDNHAFTVIDITERPFRVVASYSDATTDLQILPDLIYRTANIYNEAYVLVEVMSTGGQVVDTLFNTLQYPNLLGAEMKGRAGQVLCNYKKNAKGIKTSKASKPIGCTNLKTLVENDQLFLNDFKIVNELSSFVRVNNSFEADVGNSDDLVMTLVNFAWATTQGYFSHLTKANIRSIFKEKIKEIEENLLPFGFILDSFEEPEEPPFYNLF